jgi:sulfate transport system ATP-binding protein
VGECSADGIQLGPVRFPLGTRGESPDERRRVQVLFRPEDVAVRESAEALSRLACPPLGRAVVEQRAFIGAYERLRLRLPPLPGVRPIAPTVPFGSQEIVVEATRTPDEARRYPLQTGEPTWVGVRRVHALAHPGLRLLLLADGSEPSRAAVELGGQLARLAHARVTVLGHRIAAPPAGGGARPRRDEDLEALLQQVRETLGSGLAALDTRPIAGSIEAGVADEEARQPADLVVVGRPSRDGVELAERLLAGGSHHLLLTPSRPLQALERLLICVAIGEPGKADVSFAGRLARHLGAAATILTVLPEGDHGRRRAGGESGEGAERFLASCARTLTRQGVEVETRIRFGAPREQIFAERLAGGHDLLVVGAPLPGAYGRIDLGGMLGRLLRETDVPVLIVRSPEAAP